MTRVVVLSGPSAVGKSTVVRCLRGSGRGHVVHGQTVQVQACHDAGGDQFIVFNQEDMHGCEWLCGSNLNPQCTTVPHS